MAAFELSGVVLPSALCTLDGRRCLFSPVKLRAVHDLEEAGDAEIAKDRMTCTNVTAHDDYANPPANAITTLTPAAATCYRLVFDPESHSSVFKINAAGATHMRGGMRAVGRHLTAVCPHAVGKALLRAS